MAIFKVYDIRSCRGLVAQQQLNAYQGMVLQRRLVNGCAFSCSRSSQRCIKRMLSMATAARSLLQEWRATPNLELRGIVAPLVCLEESPSETFAEDALRTFKIGPAKEGPLDCSLGAGSRHGISAGQKSGLSDRSCPPSLCSATDPYQLTCPSAAKPPPPADLEEEPLYCEENIGAGAFVSASEARRGLQGIMRYRSEDFVVREIGEDGRAIDFSVMEGCTLATDSVKREAYKQNAVSHLHAGLPSQPTQSCSLQSQPQIAVQQPTGQTRQSAPCEASCDTGTPKNKREGGSWMSVPSLGRAQSAEKKSDSGRSCTSLALDFFSGGVEQLQAWFNACDKNFSFKFVLGKRNRETPGMKDRRAVTLQWVSCTIPRSLCFSPMITRIPLAISCGKGAGKGGSPASPQPTSGGESHRHGCLPPQRSLGASVAKHSTTRNLPQSAPPAFYLCAKAAPPVHAHVTGAVPLKGADTICMHTSLPHPSNVKGSLTTASADYEGNGCDSWTEALSVLKSVRPEVAAGAPDSGNPRETPAKVSSPLAGCSIAVRGSDSLCDTASTAQVDKGYSRNHLACSTLESCSSTSSSVASCPYPNSIQASQTTVQKLDSVTVISHSHEGGPGSPSQTKQPSSIRLRAGMDMAVATSVKTGACRASENAKTSARSDTLRNSALVVCSNGSDEAPHRASRAAFREVVQSNACSTEERSISTSFTSYSRSRTEVGGGVEELEPLYWPLRHMEEGARRAMAQPSWDPCVFWGGFRRGRVYLGGLKGNHFTIVLRNLQLGSCTDLQAPPLRETAKPVYNAEKSCIMTNKGTLEKAEEPERTRAGDCAKEEQQQEVSSQVLEVDGMLPTSHERMGALILRGCPGRENSFLGVSHTGVLGDDRAALLEEIRGAASSLTEKGFVNYFGPQRFGTGPRPTFHIGRALLRRQHCLACHLIMQIPAYKFSETVRASGAHAAAPSPASHLPHHDTSTVVRSANTRIAHIKGAPTPWTVDNLATKSYGTKSPTASTQSGNTERTHSACNSQPSTGESDSVRGVKRVTEDPSRVKTDAHDYVSFNGRRNARETRQDSTSIRLHLKPVWNYAAPSEHQRAYIAAQEAYWKGDFSLAYMLLPKSCRVERQLLRQLAASPYADRKIWTTRAISNEKCEVNNVRATDESISCKSDMAACVDAVELAAAAGATTEGAGRRAALVAGKEVADGTIMSTFKTVARNSKSSKAGASEEQTVPAETAAASSVSTGCGEEQEESLWWVGGAAFAPRDAIRRAISRLPRLQRLMYIKAYAAYLWNKCATERVRLYGADRAVPGDLVLIRAPCDASATMTKKYSERAGASTNQKCCTWTSEAGCTSSRIRILTNEDYAKFQARDVVLPLIGVGAIFPQNAVGDYMAALLEKEGLNESLYQRKSEYFLDVVYRPLLARPRSFVCQLLHLPPDFAGVVPDVFFKSQLKGPTTTADGEPSSKAMQTGPGMMKAHFLQDGAPGHPAPKQEPTAIWSFSAAEAHGTGSGCRGLEAGDEESSSRAGTGAEFFTCSGAARTKTGRNSNDAEYTIPAGSEHESEVMVTGVDLTRGLLKQRREQRRTCTMSGAADGKDTRGGLREKLCGHESETEAQHGRVGLLLRFTLDAGVFASSALREFMHRPFVHPFAQRRTEKRNHPEGMKVRD